MRKDFYAECELCGTHVGEDCLEFRQVRGLGPWGAWVCGSCADMLDEQLEEKDNEQSGEAENDG